MRRFSSRSGLSTLSEINVTPLIDLAFVLLIIFIITTPFLETTLDLILPTVHAAPEAVQPENVQTLSIDRGGNMELNGDPVLLPAIPDQLRFLAEQHEEEIAVVIRPHRELPVQTLVQLMETIREAGITKVGIISRAE